MNKMLRSLVAAASLVVLSPFASATVLDFDNLSDGFLPANYGGLTWVADAWSVFSGEQAPYAAHSGEFRIATQWEGTDATATIGFSVPSTFQGAYFSGYEEGAVQFKLFSGSQLVASSAVLSPSATPSFLSSGYDGLVDTVVVSSTGHAYFAMDDVTFTAAVPEPESYAMLLCGLGLVGFVARRCQFVRQS